MDENTKKVIKDRFESLPESIKEVIMSSNYQETLLGIGRKYQLNIEQLGILERETTIVMMGLTPTEEFESELTKELGVDKSKGMQMVNEINEKIFVKIRDLLKLMNTKPGEEPIVEDESENTSEKTPVPSHAPVETGNNNKNNDILKTTGVEVRPAEISGGKTSLPENKLADSFKIPAAKTEYTLNNISKSSAQSGSAVNGATSQVSVKPGAPKVDPYRMPIE